MKRSVVERVKRALVERTEHPSGENSFDTDSSNGEERSGIGTNFVSGGAKVYWEGWTKTLYNNK